MRKQNGSVITGTIKRHADGFGFLIPDDPEYVDVYVPRQHMTGVMGDDQIEIQCHEERMGRFSGRVLRILKRSFTQVVGRYSITGDGGNGVILDDGKAWGENIVIDQRDTKGAKHGQLVVVHILSYPGDPTGFRGEVVDILGTHGDPALDTKQMIYQHHIPMEFTKRTLEQVQVIPETVTEKDWAGRKDLRSKKLVTIDGATARDFDDAVYAEHDKRGFRLWVAIADVSAYVPVNTDLDKDAYSRGTSVYFPDLVVPMLPEKLSNNLCSLNPHVPRLCMVAEMVLGFTGELLESSFYEAVMESRHRMIYGDVEDIINGFDNPKYADVLTELRLLKDISKILMAKRFREGSLDLEIPESEIILDAMGVPTDVIRGERLFSHRLIEELMLQANVAVAKFIESKNAPSLYRVHESPFEDALKTLEVMAHNWGVSQNLRKGMIQKQLMKLLERVKGRPEEHILSILILRSMKQAEYNVENKGHFGLAFPCYTHFTSPIRRYPDLVVHRILKALIKGRDVPYPFEKVASIGTMTSACEQRAAKASRELLAIKRCRFMERHVGQEFEGMVTGVQKFGIFVQLKKYDIDGLIRLDTFTDDHYFFDEANQQYVGRKSKRVLKLGDPARVVVLRSDAEAQEIDFRWLNEGETAENMPKLPERRPFEPRQNQPPRKSKGFRDKKDRGSKKKGSGKKNRKRRR